MTRLLLGFALAATGPVVVSLTGDFIEPGNRAQILGWILSGEIVGSGIGLVIAGAGDRRGRAGRCGASRAAYRLVAEAGAPATFGWLADRLGGRTGEVTGMGLRNAFIIMLVTLLANGLILIAALRTYPVDVATAPLAPCIRSDFIR